MKFDFHRVRRRSPAKMIVALFFCLLASQSVSAADAADRDFAGQLLVASDEMKDPRFVETVIYLVRHNAEGTLGLVINRPVAKGPIDDLLKGFGAPTKGSKREVTIHYGGPVGTRQGFVLHSDEVKIEDTLVVKDGIAMTSDVKMIEAIAAGHGPKQSLVMLGYAGWAPGQLAAEIKSQAWFLIPADKSIIFGKDADKKWIQATARRQIPL